MKQQKSHDTVTSGGSVLSRYQDVVVGSHSLKKTIFFEWCMWLSKIPGQLD